MRYIIAGMFFGFGTVSVAACMLSSRISARERRVKLWADPPGDWRVRENGLVNRLRDAGMP